MTRAMIYAVTLAVTASLSQATTPTIAAQNLERDAQACRVTLATLTAFAPQRPWRLGEGEPQGVSLNWRTMLDLSSEDPDWFVIDPKTGLPDGAPSKGPSAATIKAMIESAPVDGARCKAVQDFADAHSARIRDRDVAESRAVDGLYPRTYVSVQKAVLSPDGTEALVYIDGASGPLAGGGFLAFYRRGADREWRRIADLPLWIS